ncbi:hypothetical protein D3C85_1643240 [compost metagenome]
MDHSGVGNEQDAPAFAPKANTPVQVLAVHEIGLVEQADLLHRGTSQQHACAGNGLDLNGMIGQWRLMQVEVGKELRPT